MNYISQRLKELRQEKGVSQKEIAKTIGISVSAYSNYEQGIREPSNEILIRLCKYFNVTSDYLLGLNEYE